MAPQAQIDSVLVQDRLPDAVDHLESAGREIDVPQRSVGTAFQRNRPAVGILDREVLDAEVLDERQEDADVPPVAGLALPGDPRVGAVGLAPIVLPLSPVARGRSAPSSTAWPMPRMWMFRIGWMSVMPRPQFALRMKLSRQRSESLIRQLSSSSVVLLRSRMAESSSQNLAAARRGY